MTDDENRKSESESLPFYRNKWFWSTVFFAAVCVVGSLTGDNNFARTDPLENARYINSAVTSAVSVLSETDMDTSAGTGTSTDTDTDTVAVASADIKISESTSMSAEVQWDEITVYITPTGERYHIRSSCAGKNAIKTDIDTAKEKYTPCKRCAKILCESED